MQTIQDMNLVRRIVRKAESDHYALYRAYKLLKECGYTKTLLGLSMSEHSSSCSSLDASDATSSPTTTINSRQCGGDSGATSSRDSASSRSSTGSNGSVGQEIMGEDVISILLEHLPEDRHQTFSEVAPSPCSTAPAWQIRANS